MKCTACNSTELTATKHIQVFKCEACGGLLSTGIYRGDVSDFVNLYEWHTGVEDARYFDFTILSGDLTVGRVHGWFDRKSKRLTQVG
jgi:hypothetical protein